ncbi:MAG: hypothetical protein Ct9H90mP2_09930 [Dehalococcoidia bacterium]|nr:MAG: hypothetical protein Ct9H90mP2_09930 [Dehalococcoidia bacterium]
MKCKKSLCFWALFFSRNERTSPPIPVLRYFLITAILPIFPFSSEGISLPVATAIPSIYASACIDISSKSSISISTGTFCPFYKDFQSNIVTLFYFFCIVSFCNFYIHFYDFMKNKLDI